MMAGGLAESPRDWQDIRRVVYDPTACHAADERYDYANFHAPIIVDLGKLKNDVSYL